MSDWSSDVCSSDLVIGDSDGLVNVGGTEDHGDRSEYLILPERSFQRHIDQDSGGKISAITLQRPAAEQKGCAKLFRDRKSVVTGKSVSVRVDLGGRSIITKKKNKNNKHTKQ